MRVRTLIVHNSKVRLDEYLVETKLATDLDSSRAIIGAGAVLVDERITDKAGCVICRGSVVRLKERCPYVSRGGLKLAAGITSFELVLQDKICVDIGASTGGFTDCLLEHGAARVFAIDVAYGQLAWKLRQDHRVVVLERFNARKLRAEDLHGEHINFAVIDVSFISLTKILPPLIAVFPGDIEILALIKPQFELARKDIASGGVVMQPELHDKAVTKIADFVKQAKLHVRGITESPILGPKGNKEFLISISSGDNR
jgi:23S rRNA (cytidine1920-2'-O)/16S rRNA (cytidine1409-2'-O)-methyltransferase